VSQSIAAASPRAVSQRARWNLRGLSVVAFAHGLSDFYSGIVPFVIFYVVTREHLSPAYQGALGFVWYLTSSIVQPLFGAYSDRRGRWWFLPSAVLLTVVAVSAAGTVHSLWALALCIVVGGLGSAVMHPEAGKYSAMLSGRRKAGGISIFQIGGQIGYAAGPAVVAVLLARYGGAGTLLLIVPGVLATAALFAVMRRLDRSAARTHARTESVAAAAAAPDRMGVTLLVTSTGLRYFTNAAFMTFLPNVLVARGASLPVAGQVVSAFLLISALGLLMGGYLADRWGAVRVSIVSLCAAAPCFLGFFAFGGLWSIALLLCAAVLLAVQNAPGVALVQSMLPRNLGMALGLMNGVAFGVGSALVATIGLAVARVGAPATLQVVGLVPVLAALPFAVVGWRKNGSRA
jgi:FSR family fosmidomycin resistance protein-like MFS transporter